MTSTVQTKQIGVEDSVTTVTSFLEVVHLQEDEPYNFVDNPTKLSSVLDAIHDLPTNPPSLYIDLEGENLCRHGTISILQLYVYPTENTYLIDVYTLADAAFTTAGKNGSTLKGILESSVVPKVFFDVRNDSDALYSHYKINLQGVQDLQLMELVTRQFAGRYINGLAKCIEKDLSFSPREKIAWQDTKKKGRQLFAPELGGSYKVFNDRPLSDAIKLYCVQDVKLLPRLWLHYNRLMTARKVEKVRQVAIERVRESQSSVYQPYGRQKALIPKGW
ncbi:putative Ribonuclease H-like domain-containing protein [Seiridium cardinale]